MLPDTLPKQRQPVSAVKEMSSLVTHCRVRCNFVSWERK